MSAQTAPRGVGLYLVAFDGNRRAEPRWDSKRTFGQSDFEYDGFHGCLMNWLVLCKL